MTRTGDGPITYTGGVAQNSVFNGKLHESGIDVRIPPHANDCGLSLGAVEFLRQKFHEEPFDTTGFPFWQDDEAPEEPTDKTCLLYTSPSPRDATLSRMPSSA